MKSVCKVLGLLLASTSFTAAASRLHYQDNKGLLYCQMKCTVDASVHTVGLYPKNAQGNNLKVKGKWIAEGLTISGSGKYSVLRSVFDTARGICVKERSQLLQLEPVRGVLADPALSGADEKNCRIVPKITTDAGLLTFDITVEEVEDDHTDL